MGALGTNGLIVLDENKSLFIIDCLTMLCSK